MVERVDKEEGGLRAKEEMGRAEEELGAARVLQERGFYLRVYLRRTIRSIMPQRHCFL